METSRLGVNWSEFVGHSRTFPASFPFGFESLCAVDRNRNAVGTEIMPCEASQIKPPSQTVCRLWATILLAQEMGA